MCAFVTGTGGEIVAKTPTSFVSTTLLEEIQRFSDEGHTQAEIYSILRNRTVPAGYTYTSWKPGNIYIYLLIVAKFSCGYVFQKYINVSRQIWDRSWGTAFNPCSTGVFLAGVQLSWQTRSAFSASTLRTRRSPYHQTPVLWKGGWGTCTQGMYAEILVVLWAQSKPSHSIIKAKETENYSSVNRNHLSVGCSNRSIAVQSKILCSLWK